MTDELVSLEAALQPFLHPDFFFVNIGANDGVTNDPIYPFIERYGWRGIAVEPVPYLFQRLKDNYRHLDHLVTLVQAAVSDTSDTSRPIWYVTEHDGTAEGVVAQIGSLDRDRVEQTLHELTLLEPYAKWEMPTDVQLDSQSVRCVGFNALMEAEGVDHIDYLNIDTEGLDLEILTSIDLDRFCPSVLCIEVVTLEVPEKRQLRATMADLGFEILQPFETFSVVFGRPDAVPGR